MIIHTTKGKREIKCPDSWATTSTAHYQNLMREWDGKDLVKLFAILTGENLQTIANSHDLALEEALLMATNFIYIEPQTFKNAPTPKQFIYKKQFITFPKQVEGFSIGQSILIRQRLDEVKTYDELISYALAVYLQPKIDGGDFDSDRVDEIEDEILKMPITETYALGFFLLNPLMRRGVSGWRIARLLAIRYLKRLFKGANK